MKRKKGFTLIELLITVAIIGLLSAVVLVSLNSARRSANDAKRKADLKQMANAMELYYDTNNVYPGNTYAADYCSAVNCAGLTCAGGATDWTSANLLLATWMAAPPTDPRNSVTGTHYCYAVPDVDNSATTFCVVAANLEVGGTGYYVAHNGAGTRVAPTSDCP